jgi:hypothetical protein
MRKRSRTTDIKPGNIARVRIYETVFLPRAKVGESDARVIGPISQLLSEKLCFIKGILQNCQGAAGWRMGAQRASDEAL